MDIQPNNPAPTMKPQVGVKPIADHDSGVHDPALLAAASFADHGLYGLVGGELSGALLPETAMAQTHHVVAHVDHVIM